MKKITVICCVLLSACTSTKVSNKKSGEQLELKTYQYEEPLTYQSVSEGLDIEESTRGFVTTDLLLKSVDFAFEGIKTAIKKSAEKYHQEYFFSLYNNSFYSQNSTLGMLDPENIRFRGFEIERSITLEDGRQAALRASFSMDQDKLIDIYTQSKFYFKCDSLSIEFCKVKMNDKDWYLPWTLFMKEQTAINVDVNIDMLANWIDDQGVIHRQQPFGKFHFPIRDFKVGTSDSTYSGAELGGFCYVIPRSRTYCLNTFGVWEPCYGQGDFDILVKVTESSKNNKLNKLIYDNVDVLDQVDAQPLKDLVD